MPALNETSHMVETCRPNAPTYSSQHEEILDDSYENFITRESVQEMMNKLKNITHKQVLGLTITMKPMDWDSHCQNVPDNMLILPLKKTLDLMYCLSTIYMHLPENIKSICFYFHLHGHEQIEAFQYGSNYTSNKFNILFDEVITPFNHLKKDIKTVAIFNCCTLANHPILYKHFDISVTKNTTTQGTGKNVLSHYITNFNNLDYINQDLFQLQFIKLAQQFIYDKSYQEDIWATDTPLSVMYKSTVKSKCNDWQIVFKDRSKEASVWQSYVWNPVVIELYNTHDEYRKSTHTNFMETAFAIKNFIEDHSLALLHLIDEFSITNPSEDIEKTCTRFKQFLFDLRNFDTIYSEARKYFATLLNSDTFKKLNMQFAMGIIDQKPNLPNVNDIINKCTHDTIFTLCRNYHTKEELISYIKSSPNFHTDLFNMS